MSEMLVLYIDFESFTYILIFEFFTLIFRLILNQYHLL